MLDQEMLMKADPDDPDEGVNSEIHNNELISCSLYEETLRDSNILQNYTEAY